MRLALVALLCLAAAPVLGAQRSDAVRKRPKLPVAVDTNDADAYHQLGESMIVRDPELAADAFYWAARLNPYSAAALYGQHTALLMADPRRIRRYLTRDARSARAPDLMQLDSLLVRALMLDPFLYRRFDHFVMRRHFEHFVRVRASVVDGPTQAEINHAFAMWIRRADPATQGWAAYCEGRFHHALQDYADALRKEKSQAYLRTERGRIFYLTRQYDSALAEFGLALEELRSQDSKELVVGYVSKALLEHGTAKIHERLGDVAAAREAYARALQEDLAFYPAHVSLGILALQDGDTATALTELELAIQIREWEPMVRLYYGYLLGELRRYADAQVHLAKAIELEPFYARSYQLLGHVYDAQGRRAEAVAQYQAYLARAALKDGPRESIAQRLEVLRAPPGGTRR